MLLLSQIDHTKKKWPKYRRFTVPWLFGILVIVFKCGTTITQYFCARQSIILLCFGNVLHTIISISDCYSQCQKFKTHLLQWVLRRPSVFKDDAAASFSCRNLGMGRSKQGTLWPEPFFSTLWNWSPCNRQVMYEKWPQMHGRGSIALSKALWLTKL